jgi:hypothetical protein
MALSMRRTAGEFFWAIDGHGKVNLECDFSRMDAEAPAIYYNQC